VAVNDLRNVIIPGRREAANRNPVTAAVDYWIPDSLASLGFGNDGQGKRRS
jgi:hypothetical protein